MNPFFFSFHFEGNAKQYKINVVNEKKFFLFNQLKMNDLNLKMFRID